MGRVALVRGVARVPIVRRPQACPAGRAGVTPAPRPFAPLRVGVVGDTISAPFSPTNASGWYYAGFVRWGVAHQPRFTLNSALLSRLCGRFRPFGTPNTTPVGKWWMRQCSHLDSARRRTRLFRSAPVRLSAIQSTVKRLAGVMAEQAAASASKQQTLLTDDDASPPPPAQLAFSTWRVNDYDLAIQHNEAVNLACEHLGVERTKTDAFFDGSLGKRLVKIVPFNHPATLLDLQAAADGLAHRPDEPRDAVLVALGLELACERWLEDYNRHRPINKLEIIELGSDPKYGHFFEHRPASARVRLDGSRVVIDDFISPSILERLGQTEGVLALQVTDWRSMVDSVMIDTAYDGNVFNVVVADVPERKSDVVAGTYELELPAGSAAPVAVKITDMLGEEVQVLLPRP